MAWTRVKELAFESLQRLQIFDVEADLKSDKILKQIRKGSVRDIGTILFDPDEYKDVNYQFSLENHKLHQDELLRYATMATNIRRNISQSVSAMEEEDKDQAGEIEIKQIQD